MKQVTITCRCKQCIYFEESNNGVGYCYYWEYEHGESPNMTTVADFCSYAEKRN